MNQIQLNDRELMFLSDLISDKNGDVKAELEAYKEEIRARGGTDPELDELCIEMEQDFALCSSILEKINTEING